jgi:SNF2 family DNA or RNA helicase
MSQVTMDVTFNKIILRVSSGDYDSYAMSISASVKNDKIGEFEYPLSTQNLERIFKVFDGRGVPKPIVRSGERFIQEQREKWRAYNNAKSQLRDIMKLDQYPLEPNGKFIPYKHQTKIVGSLLVDPFLPVGADCGTGKTGSALRAAEILLNQGTIKRGKILVSAPLSILQTSWADDAAKFTDLKVKTLWTPVSNKKVKVGDLVQVSKNAVDVEPEGTLTRKKKKGMRWLRSDGFVKQMRELDPFDDADAKSMGLSWRKIEATWMEAHLMDGSVIPYGPIWGQQVEKEETRKNILEEMLNDNAVDIYLINHDGVRIYEEMLKAHKFEWVIIDESTKIKSMNSKVTRSHIEISWNALRRTTMSGTPNPNGFLDLWSQYYFLDRGMTLNTKIKDFQRDYFTPIKIGHFGGQDAVKWELRDPRSRDALVEKVRSTSIFLKQRDCVDLPPRTDMVREIVMTAAQSKAYKEMEKDLVSDFLDQKTKQNLTVEAVNTLSKLMKLRQMTSGFVGHSEGTAALESMKDNPKLVEMDDLLEEIGDNKVVIACQFKEEIYALLDRYRHLGASAVFGDAKLSDRIDAINKFQKTNELKIIILQPQAAAHGITLTEAHYFVFLSLDYNFEYYYQVGKRIERIGQRNPMFMYHFLAKTEDGCDTIDHDLMDVLRSKSQDRDILFNNDSDIVDIANTLKNKIIQRVQQG